jgi:hypothetical protein
MTTWYSGHGWGWCGVIVNIPTMVLFWGFVITAMVFAVRMAVRRPSDPPTPTGTGYPGPKAVVAADIAQGEPDDELYRRLM